MRPRAALAAVAALTIALAATVAPAFAARSSYVIDDAHLLSSNTVAQLNQKIGDFNAQTGKEVVVVTTDSLNGVDPNTALERSFAQNQVNGVEIFIAKNEKQIKIAGDRASRQFFPSGSFNAVYQAMRPYFAQGNFDQGVLTGVDLVINTYRGHMSSLNRGRQPVGAGSHSAQRSDSGGFSLSWIWWIIILAVIFFVIRGIFRALAGPRTYGPGPYGPGGPGYGGAGYGGPGYGGGPGFGGGGGGFWSGLLGGLGGAWLGNELFGGRRDWGGGEGGTYAGTGPADAGASQDASGWQSDAGQIDTGNVGGGGWGDPGGGFGGDSGGGWGGGDGGGGGGDSGGGW